MTEPLTPVLHPKTGEVMVKLVGGNVLYSGWIDKDDPDKRSAGDYLRLEGPGGNQLLYFGADEWQTNPQQVIGEIIETCSALQRHVPDAIPDLHRLGIRRFLQSGEFNEDEIGTVGELLRVAGRYLDKACAGEIFGQPVIFECENDQFYELSVEGLIGEPCMDDVRDLLAGEADAEGNDAG